MRRGEGREGGREGGKVPQSRFVRLWLDPKAVGAMGEFQVGRGCLPLSAKAKTSRSEGLEVSGAPLGTSWEEATEGH